jgi:hypothetical protein
MRIVGPRDLVMYDLGGRGALFALDSLVLECLGMFRDIIWVPLIMVTDRTVSWMETVLETFLHQNTISGYP